MSSPSSDRGNRAGFRTEPGEAPRVVIVSDVLLYREGLAASLASDGRLQVVGAVGVAEAPAVLSGLGPDAALLDAAMNGGLPLARLLRASQPSIRLVGFGISGGAETLLACAESGLSAFVDSNGTVDELIAAVANALRGELRCSPQVTAMICSRLASLASTHETLPATLTRREREVAALIAEGLSNKEIASDLRIGPATVKNHVHNILDKLGVRRRAAIAGHLRQATWLPIRRAEPRPARRNSAGA
jgi:two-component system, NarL family, nitrate/nitrite response regulator NarL